MKHAVLKVTWPALRAALGLPADTVLHRAKFRVDLDNVSVDLCIEQAGLRDLLLNERAPTIGGIATTEGTPPEFIGWLQS